MPGTGKFQEACLADNHPVFQPRRHGRLQAWGHVTLPHVHESWVIPFVAMTCIHRRDGGKKWYFGVFDCNPSQG